MFYIPGSGTLSGASSDSGDGRDGGCALPASASSRNLSGLLDEQRKRGIGAALLTITGTRCCLFLNTPSELYHWRRDVTIFSL